MVGWHHQFNGHEAGQTLGDGEGQGGLEYCSPWSCIKSDTVSIVSPSISHEVMGPEAMIFVF